jgi:UDP-N-acetylenolpyruvoylglucosamine reductase
MYDIVDSVRIMDLNGGVRELPRRDLPVQYRSCPLFKDHIALGAVLKAQPGSREIIESLMKQFGQKRWSSQPAAPSAGCIFKNPADIPAGKLIDELQLKGTRVGDAMVSHEHGNFIVNDGEARAADILALMALIQQRAKAERGIELEPEVEIIGQDCV